MITDEPTPSPADAQAEPPAIATTPAEPATATETAAAPAAHGPDSTDAASPLAVTAAALGVLGVVCALSVVWFLLSVPLGLIAAGCAIADRRRHRGQDRTPSSTSTVGLVLGLAVLPMAVGAFLLIPHVEQVAERAAAALQGGVQDDLDSLERTTTHNVDSLDSTLTHLVDETDRGWRKEVDTLEQTTTDDLHSLERELRASLDAFDRANAEELGRLERSLVTDVRAEDGRAASFQTQMRTEFDALTRRIDELVARIEGERASTAASGAPTGPTGSSTSGAGGG